jgi:predicted nucleotidyltransferase
MRTIEQIRDFLDAFVSWASAQPDIHAIGLVGSYARAVARDDSDIDLVVLTEQPQKYLAETVWIEEFGQIEKYQFEDYGKLTSLRVWYLDGNEVEYGITVLDWAALPLDKGTQQVISDGMLVLFERSALLSPHIANG